MINMVRCSQMKSELVQIYDKIWLDVLIDMVRCSQMKSELVQNYDKYG